MSTAPREDEPTDERAYERAEKKPSTEPLTITRPHSASTSRMSTTSAGECE